MGQRKMLYIVITLFIFFILTGCTQDEVQRDEQDSEGAEQAAAEEETEEDNTGIQLTPYAEEVGFSLTSPEQDRFTANTTVNLEGTITETDDLTGNNLWIVMTAADALEELPGNEFNYYVPIEDGSFSQELNLHQGAGEYKVSVRAPSNQANEEEIYFETAAFEVTNEDEDVYREVEYTEYGVLNDVQLFSPEQGLDQHDEGTVFVEGSVPEDYPGEMVLVQVEKDNEDRQILFPVEGGTFQGEVPLYFGEGLHHVRVQSYNEEDDLYYEAASFYADHQGEKTFAEMEKFNQYIERGVTLHAPAWNEAALQTDQEYRIAGEIDPGMPGADAITHIIVTVINLDAQEEEAGYVIPVEDYQFDGLAYFRFGPGNYEVIVNVPDHERQNQSMFYFEAVARIKHEVNDIPDERGILPSRGIESDHPTLLTRRKRLLQAWQVIGKKPGQSTNLLPGI
ncbi:hypothetical protein [Virgibacillus sp. YIM 98842]|uniref:hypothetical protein n=1 Tax=Virgibacillus sp. YIM 98842 TaxID=2663533 RepID=UPI001F09C5D5|nr:hypothetical protein [Virgibacillus sp. YIM 98842]